MTHKHIFISLVIILAALLCCSCGKESSKTKLVDTKWWIERHSMGEPYLYWIHFSSTDEFSTYVGDEDGEVKPHTGVGHGNYSILDDGRILFLNHSSTESFSNGTIKGSTLEVVNKYKETLVFTKK